MHACVHRTVEEDLPREIEYLRRHDQAIQRIMEAVEMPVRLAENLVMFIRQNRGRLSKNRRASSGSFATNEVVLIEGIVRDAFEGFNDPGGQASA